MRHGQYVIFNQWSMVWIKFSYAIKIKKHIFKADYLFSTYNIFDSTICPFRFKKVGEFRELISDGMFAKFCPCFVLPSVGFGKNHGLSTCDILNVLLEHKLNYNHTSNSSSKSTVVRRTGRKKGGRENHVWPLFHSAPLNLDLKKKKKEKQEYFAVRFCCCLEAGIVDTTVLLSSTSSKSCLGLKDIRKSCQTTWSRIYEVLCVRFYK